MLWGDLSEELRRIGTWPFLNSLGDVNPGCYMDNLRMLVMFWNGLVWNMNMTLLIVIDTWNACLYIYISIYIYMCVYIYIYMYVIIRFQYISCQYGMSPMPMRMVMIIWSKELGIHRSLGLVEIDGGFSSSKSLGHSQVPYIYIYKDTYLFI